MKNLIKKIIYQIFFFSFLIIITELYLDTGLNLMALAPQLEMVD